MNTALTRSLLLSSALALAPHARAESLPAQIRYAQRVELSVPVSGVIDTVTVAPGDAVSKNQVLLTLDATPFQAAVQDAQATVTQRQVAQQQAMRDYKQAQALYDRTVLSTVDLQNAEMRASDAYAGLLAARAALAQAQYQLRRSSIRAPFDGVVLARQAEPGQTVVSNLMASPLLVVAVRGRYIAAAAVPPARVPMLTPGTTVNVKVGDASYKGVIQVFDVQPPVCAGVPPQAELRVLFQASAALQPGQGATIGLP